MGTSKAYGSPKWPGVNRTVGAAANSSSSEQKVAVAVRAFSRAYKNFLTSGTIPPGAGGQGGGTAASRNGARGGGRGGGGGGAARSAAAKGGSQLAHFINTAGRSGIEAALRDFDLSDIRDKPLDEFLDALADRLAGDGGLLDDDALNRAMAETFDTLAEGAESVDALDDLLSSGNVDVESILQLFYTKLLAHNFEQKQYAIVREKIGRENTAGFFEQARNIIEAIVRDELSAERDLASIDWNSDDGLRIADDINQEVMDILIP
jgi:hypothetical protein